MAVPAADRWAKDTRGALARAGHRSSGPRSAVVDALAERDCGATARELADTLSRRGRRVGLASVYRALELLEAMGRVQRFELGEGVARYEPAHPGGDHHHHLVCESCGDVVAFEDPGLEKAIERVSGRVDFAVGAHDVTLRGECPQCATPA